MNTKAVIFSSPGVVTIGEVELPEPRPDEVVIKTSFTCISPGTELRVLAGDQPGMPEYPVVPGYALAGIIVASGEDAGILPGTRVLCSGTAQITGVNRCWGGHIGHAIRRAGDIYLLPPTLSLRDAPLTPLAAIAHRGVQLSQPRTGETVIVIGLGPIGVLSARLHALYGARVVGMDLRPERAALIQNSGLEAVSGEDGFAQLRALVPDGADIIVDATGAPDVVAQAVSLARDLPFTDTEQRGARYVLQGSYPGSLSLPYQAAFMKELTFLLPRNTRPSDIRKTLELIAQKQLIVHDLASAAFAPEEATRAYALLQERDPSVQTLLFEWSRF